MEPIKSFIGCEFDKQQQLVTGDVISILRLRDAAIEPVLATAWLDLWKQHLLQTIWPGGVPGLRWLMDWAADPKNAIFGMFVQRAGKDGIGLVGLGWIVERRQVGFIDGAEPKQVKPQFSAEVGMTFWKDIWGTKLPEELAEMTLDYGFEKLDLIAAYGTIPAPKRVAVAFAKRMNFTYLGPHPHMGSWPDDNGIPRPCDCEVFVLTREAWAGTRSLDRIDKILAEDVPPEPRSGQQEVM